MGRIKLEILPGMGDAIDRQAEGHLVLEEIIDEGTTIGDLMRKLASQYQAFGDSIFDTETNKMSGNVAIALNDRLVEALEGLDTPVNDGDMIKLFAVIAGG
ncbi:MAG: MoaD/ThiS family protein [Dehalococcoidales bacterium]|nr:MoaD/ThiS family protein [Dehalococcoidales bacterium]